MKIYTQEDLVKFLEIAKKSEEELSKITKLLINCNNIQLMHILCLDSFTNLVKLRFYFPVCKTFPSFEALTNLQTLEIAGTYDYYSPAKQFPSLDALTNLDSLTIDLPSLEEFPEHSHAKCSFSRSIKNNYPKWLNYEKLTGHILK